MTRTLFFAISLIIVAACGNKQQVPPTVHPDTSDWTPLFSEDLSNAEYPEGIWTVEDGVLTASEDQNIWTSKEYDNYILDLEFKTDEGTNSGVVVYCSDRKNWIPNSIEIQIADDYAEKWAKSHPTWQCAAFFGRKAASKRTVKHPGEWNHFTITCKDNMIWVMLNGEQVNIMDMTLFTDAKVNPDGVPAPSWLSNAPAGMPTKGYIGLQGKHAGAPVWFRNLRVKILE